MQVQTGRLQLKLLQKFPDSSRHLAPSEEKLGMQMPRAECRFLASLLVLVRTVRSSLLEGPCDIYARGATPCVAAHSLTRALYGAYSGALYQVRRAKDGATRDIPVLAGAGVADSALQDSFCEEDACTVFRIYDQSPGKNLGCR